MSSEVTPQSLLITSRSLPISKPAPVKESTGALPAKPELKLPAQPAVEFDPRESQRKLSEAIAHLNEMMKSTGTNLNFSRDEGLNQVIITVKNTETGDVIRQIPDATFLKVAHNIESLKGLLHNEQI